MSHNPHVSVAGNGARETAQSSPFTVDSSRISLLVAPGALHPCQETLAALVQKLVMLEVAMSILQGSRWCGGMLRRMAQALLALAQRQDRPE